MSRSARDRWNRERRERAEKVLADCQSGLLARRIEREVRAVLADLREDREIERGRIEMLRVLSDRRRSN